MIAHLAFYSAAFWEQSHDSPPTDDDCRRVVTVLLNGPDRPL